MRPFVQRLVLAAAVLAATLASAAAQGPAKVESAYANLPNGVKLHYLVAGEGGTPVILLHGFAQTSHMWLPLIPELATASAMTCAPPATEIGLGEAVRAEIAASAQSKERKYFCVQVPPGVSGLSIEVSDATADLNLFAAFPDLETLQQGGVWFWSADDPGTGDKTLVIEPAGRDTVNAGPYYIEVSAEDAGAASFTLTVRIREPE